MSFSEISTQCVLEGNSQVFYDLEYTYFQKNGLIFQSTARERRGTLRSASINAFEHFQESTSPLERNKCVCALLTKEVGTVKRKLTIKVCPSPKTFCVSLRETHGSTKKLNPLSKSMCFSFKVQLVGWIGELPYVQQCFEWLKFRKRTSSERNRVCAFST